jgi:hypothetical protein
MTFDSNHYVPVLKAKRGEKRALRSVSAGLCSRITPLIEVVERAGPSSQSLDAHLNTAFKDLSNSVSSFTRCFLDAREMVADGPQAADEVFKRAVADGIRFTPVTGISRTADVNAALANRTNGLAIRLTREEFEAGRIPVGLNAFLNTHKLDPEHVDLIVDLGAVDDLVVPGIAALAKAFLGAVPEISRWRTLTVSACAFPNHMGGVQRHSFELVERAEWVAWRDKLHATRSSLPRLPAFSDCGIQHPVGVEGFDFRIMQVSASVRYALPEEWLLIKGESTKSTPPSSQFPVLATRLVYGHLSSYFQGESHCDGCSSIKAAADGQPKLGSAEVWRRLGTVHHITTAVEGLDSLSWP